MSERLSGNTRSLRLAIPAAEHNPYFLHARFRAILPDRRYGIKQRNGYGYEMKSKILVSACLMGFQVRYNGSNKAQLADALSRWQQEGRLVIHCPELAAGLPVPRLPAEILNAQGADVMQNRAQIVESDGQDVTAHYQLAAWLALKAAQEEGCAAALLTDGSPTCGSQFIYDGTFNGQRKPGSGVAAALLREHGITVFSDGQIPQLLNWMEQRESDDDSM